MIRDLNRFSERHNTLYNLFRDVNKIKNTPVSGDIIAEIKRG